MIWTLLVSKSDAPVIHPTLDTPLIKTVSKFYGLIASPLSKYYNILLTSINYRNLSRRDNRVF